MTRLWASLGVTLTLATRSYVLLVGTIPAINGSVMPGYLLQSGKSSNKGQGGTPPQLTCCSHRRKREAHLLVIGEGCGGEEWRAREGWRGTDGGEGVGRKGKPLSPPSSHPHHLLVHLFVQPADHWRKNQTSPLTAKISLVGYKYL